MTSSRTQRTASDAVMGKLFIDWDALEGRQLGAFKAAATRIGLAFDEYRDRLDNGQRWCTACKQWDLESAFDSDASRRGIGLKATCKNVMRVRARGRFRPFLGKERARSCVNVAVRYGRLPRANSLPCTDCRHVWRAGELRHEYDHYKGYEAENWLAVQAVCTPCHRLREAKRVG